MVFELIREMKDAVNYVLGRYFQTIFRPNRNNKIGEFIDSVIPNTSQSLTKLPNQLMGCARQRDRTDEIRLIQVQGNRSIELVLSDC